MSAAIVEGLRRNATIGLAFGLAGVLFLIGTAHSSEFASFNHIRNVLVAASFVGLVGFGQTLCILTGGIDLSIPATVAGGAVLTGYLADQQASRLLWIVPLLVALGLVVGLVNGLGVAYAGVPPIIMTLGMAGALQGLLLIYTNGGRASSPPPELVDFVTGKTFGLSNQILVWAGVTLLATVLLTWTTFGRRLYAVGTNATAAYLAGVKVRRVLVVPYVISAVGGALTGVLLFGYLGQAFVNMGDDYLFSSAVAVAVGGASILGGNGHYIGTVAGAIVLTLIAGLLPLFSLGTAALQISYGVILLATVFFASVRLTRRPG